MRKGEVRVIINADDFGLNSKVNEAIIQCIQNGMITSTTIMAEGGAFEDAIDFAKKNDQISFGVHLTLDELSSLTKSPVLYQYGITDVDGVFIKGGVFKVKEWTWELKNAIEKELEAQINKIIDAGLRPSHFDGHHHCHTIPALHNILIKLTQKYNVQKVRLPLDSRTVGMVLKHITPVTSKAGIVKEAPSSSNNEGVLILRRIKSYYKEFSNRYFFIKHFMTTSFCCSVSSFNKNRTYLQNAMANRTIEIMCHPGHPDYVEEMELLKQIKNSILVISYAQL